jgi:hypothetical protein
MIETRESEDDRAGSALIAEHLARFAMFPEA